MTFREARERKCLSRLAFATATHIHISQVYKYESGEARACHMTLSTASRVAAALGLTIEEVMHLEPEQIKKPEG